MSEKSEVITPIKELDERAGSKDSIRSDDNDLNLECIANSEKDAGRILLDFIDANPEKFRDYPNSYYSFSAKERLLMIYSENFRRQFISTYPDRKPLVLAIPNECGIQKFVSTTVRPTSFLFNELIDGWEGPTQLVADFITYEPLEDPLQLVSIQMKHDVIFFYSGKILFVLYIYNMILFESFSFNTYSFQFCVCVCFFSFIFLVMN